MQVAPRVRVVGEADQEVRMFRGSEGSGVVSYKPGAINETGSPKRGLGLSFPFDYRLGNVETSVPVVRM
jgi:hypothetical protein